MAAPDIANGDPVAARSLRSLDPATLAGGSNLIAHYKFDGDLLDSSGNGRHLAVSVGVESYHAGGPGGRRCFYFQGNTFLQLANSAHNADFQLIGDMTAVALFRPTTGALGVLFGMQSATSGSADDNLIWNVLRGTEADANYMGGIFAYHHYGVGSSSLSYGLKAPLTRDWGLASYARAVSGGNATTELMVSGYDGLASPNVTANVPAGGANTVFCVGATLGSAYFNYGYLADLMIFDARVTNAALLAAAYSTGARR